MVDNGVNTGLSRRELKMLPPFDKRGNIYCSTPCSEYSDPSGNSQKYSCHKRTRCRTVLTMPSSLPMADFKLLEGALKEARASG